MCDTAPLPTHEQDYLASPRRRGVLAYQADGQVVFIRCCLDEVNVVSPDAILIPTPDDFDDWDRGDQSGFLHEELDHRRAILGWQRDYDEAVRKLRPLAIGIGTYGAILVGAAGGDLLMMVLTAALVWLLYHLISGCLALSPGDEHF